MPKRKSDPKSSSDTAGRKRRVENEDQATTHNGQNQRSNESEESAGDTSLGLSSLGLTLDDLRYMATETFTASHRPEEEGAGLSIRTVRFRQSVWVRFEEYFENRRTRGTLSLIPGNPANASDLLDPESPHIDFPTAIAFVEWVASRCLITHIGDKMASSTAASIFAAFCSHIRDKKNSSVPSKIQRQVRIAIKSSLVDKGLTHNEPKPKFITDQNGHRDLARACLSSAFQTTDVRTRFQNMFWMAVTSQTGLRRGSILPDKADQLERAVPYDAFELHLLGDGVITLTMKPPHAKTSEGRDAVYTLVQTPELYQCPVSLFLLLAHLDDSLPVELGHLLELAQRVGDHGQQIRPKEDWLKTPLLRSPRSFGPDAPMIAATLSVDLRRLSRIVGFETNITAHAFRRMVAVYMRAHGKKYEEIQLKLAHRLESTVTRTYMNLVCPADISSAVWGGKNRTLESLVLHPRVLKQDHTAPVALDRKSRGEIFGMTEVSELADAVDDCKAQACQQFGHDTSTYPESTREDLDNHWNAYRAAYKVEYDKQLSSLLRAHHDESLVYEDEIEAIGTPITSIDDIPTNGGDFDYDTGAVEIFLSAVETADAHQVIKSTQRMINEITENDNDDDEEDEPANDPPAVENLPDSDETASENSSQTETLMTRITTSFFTKGFELKEAILLCAKLNKKGRAIYACRPHHNWSNAQCPSCDQSLWEAAEIPVYSAVETSIFTSRMTTCFATHIKRCSASLALERASSKLLAAFPSRLPELPVVLGKREPAKPLHTADDGTQNLHEMAAWLLNRPTQKCKMCPFTTDYYPIFKAHLMTAHQLWLPPADNQWTKSSVGVLYNSGEWSLRTASFPIPRWSWHDASYHPDPRELEIFSEKYFKERISIPGQSVKVFNIRPDIEPCSDQFPMDSNGTSIDDRYLLKQARGAELEQEALCFLCVWNTTKCWSERIEPIDGGHWASAIHNRRCLTRTLFGLSALFADLKVIEDGGDPEAERKAAVQAKTKAKNAIKKANRERKQRAESQQEGSTSRESEPSTPAATTMDCTFTGEIESKKALNKKNKPATKPKNPRAAKPRSGDAPLRVGPTPKEVMHLVIDGELACPDEVCRKNNHRSADEVEWIRHLVGVHQFLLFIPSRNANTIDNLAFKDNEELMDFCGLAISKDVDEA